MEVFKKGTIEPLLVGLGDRLENVNDLSVVLNPKFDTRRKSDGVACEVNKTWVIDSDFPMTAICEIDTTVVAYVPGEDYKLYLMYDSGTESPIIGPIFFRVEDD